MGDSIEISDKIDGVPIVTLRDLVVFPKTTVYFEVGRDATVNALKEAMRSSQLVFTVAQKNPDIENPGMDDLFETGTLAEVKQIINMPGKVIRVVIIGRERMKLEYLETREGYLSGTVSGLPETGDTSYALETAAMIRGLKDVFSLYTSKNGRFKDRKSVV